jgi:hypothetical protein
MAAEDVVAFEAHLSRVLAESEVSAHDCILAISIAIAKMLYGIDALHGADAAHGACYLLDTTIYRAWQSMKNEAPPTLQ